MSAYPDFDLVVVATESSYAVRVQSARYVLTVSFSALKRRYVGHWRVGRLPST